MMLAEGSVVEFREIKKLSVGEYLNKLDIFVDKKVIETKK